MRDMFLSWFTHPWFKTRMCIKELYLYSCHLPQVNPCYYPPTVFFFFFQSATNNSKIREKRCNKDEIFCWSLLGSSNPYMHPETQHKRCKSWSHISLACYYLPTVIIQRMWSKSSSFFYFFYQKQKRMWSNEAKEKTEALKYLRILGKKLAACESCKLGIFTQLILSTNIDVKMPIQPPSHLCYRLSFLWCLLLWLLLLFPKIYIMIRMRQRERDVQTMFK